MLLIDKHGVRPVCAVCRALGPYRSAALAVFVCAVCTRAVEAHVERLAERIPELRDHRLKRWRRRCDCQRCSRRLKPAV